MPLVRLQYNGTARYFETPITGTQQSWMPGQSGFVDSSYVSAFLATGMFAYDEMEPVFERNGGLVSQDGSTVSAGGGVGFNRYTRVITIGDSITAMGTTSGWFVGLLLAANGRIRHVRDAAIPGQVTQQMIDRYASDVTPYAPLADELWIQTGTNDASTADTAPIYAANLIRLAKLGQSDGLRVRLFTIPPKNTAVARALEFRDVALSVGEYLGIPTYDLWQGTISTTLNGQFNAADTIDGVHPSAAGHTKASTAGIALLGIDTTHNIALPVQNAPNGGLFANPLFVTDSNADGVADGWFKSGGATWTASLVAGDFGNKQRMVVSNQTGDAVFQTTNTSVTPGNKYELRGKISVSGLAGGSWYLRFRWLTASSTAAGDWYPFHGAVNAAGEFVLSQAAPATAAFLAIQVRAALNSGQASFSTQIDLEQFQLRDLTALGLS